MSTITYVGFRKGNYKNIDEILRMYVSHWFFLIKFQYAVGFFSFLLLLICNKGTAGFRASLVPVHAAFGILTFVLGVAACLTGLTEKALFTIGYVSIFLRRKLRFILAVEEVFFCRQYLYSCQIKTSTLELYVGNWVY